MRGCVCELFNFPISKVFFLPTPLGTSESFAKQHRKKRNKKKQRCKGIKKQGFKGRKKNLQHKDYPRKIIFKIHVLDITKRNGENFV